VSSFFLVCSFIGQYLYSVKLSEWGNKWLHQTVFVEIIAPILEERWYDYLGEFGWFQWGMPFLNSVVIKFRSEHSFVWICRSTAYQMSKNMGVKTSQSCLWNSEWKYATNKIWKCEPDIICIFFVCKIYLNWWMIIFFLLLFHRSVESKVCRTFDSSMVQSNYLRGNKQSPPWWCKPREYLENSISLYWIEYSYRSYAKNNSSWPPYLLHKF